MRMREGVILHTTVNGLPVQYDNAPNPNMVPGLIRYIEAGVAPGAFMLGVLRNDLMEACRQADDINQRLLFDWALWLHNYAPPGCYGSREKVDNWLAYQRDAYVAVVESEHRAEGS